MANLLQIVVVFVEY